MAIRIKRPNASIKVSVSSSLPATLRATFQAPTAGIIKAIAMPGPPGPPGPKGQDGDTLTNFPLDIRDPRARDILMFNGSAWANEPAADMVDGGNF